MPVFFKREAAKQFLFNLQFGFRANLIAAASLNRDCRPLAPTILRIGHALNQTICENSYLLSLDGTGYFSSNEVHCPSCLEKKNSKTGEIRYAHQLLGGAIVHPDYAEVVPFAPEAIIKQDGRPRMIVSAMPPSVFWRNCVKIIRTCR